MTDAAIGSTSDLPAARRQTRVGLALAGGILTAWGALHVYGVYLHRWSPAGIVVAPFIVAAQTWLSVGLFIVSHDAMHGSLAPRRPRLARGIGRLALALYAGFDFDRLLVSHRAHHAAPGGPDDPDFHAEAPDRFWPWFARFFFTYFGLTQMAVLTVAVLVALLVFRASISNLLVFWAVPALLSAVQLFVFGTWLPHRHESEPFPDAHNARSSGLPSWLSLLTCFHFGRHHTHHLDPSIPWWRLDRLSRRERLRGGGARGHGDASG